MKKFLTSKPFRRLMAHPWVRAVRFNRLVQIDHCMWGHAPHREALIDGKPAEGRGILATAILALSGRGMLLGFACKGNGDIVVRDHKPVRVRRFGCVAVVPADRLVKKDRV